MPCVKQYAPVIMASNGMWGSICLNDFLEGAQKATAPDGSVWVNVTSLPTVLAEKFDRNEKNGKIYAGINVWINDEPDQYGNCASIVQKKTKAEIASGAKNKYLGNLKWNQVKQTNPASPMPAAAPWGAQPPTQAPLPWAQPQQPASQPPSGPTPVTQAAIQQGASPANGWQPVKNSPF